MHSVSACRRSGAAQLTGVKAMHHFQDINIFWLRQKVKWVRCLDRSIEAELKHPQIFRTSER
jgi:hypothetical protein